MAYDIMVTTTAMAPPWSVHANGTVHTQVAMMMAKLQHVKPTVDKILNAGDIQQQAPVLRAVTDHPALATACELAGIDSSKEKATAKFLCKQSSWMMGQSCSGNTICGKTSQKCMMPLR
jgi:hypothetical protein